MRKRLLNHSSIPLKADLENNGAKTNLNAVSFSAYITNKMPKDARRGIREMLAAFLIYGKEG